MQQPADLAKSLPLTGQITHHMRSIDKSEISWSSWDNGLLFEHVSWHQSNGMVPSSALCWSGNIQPYDQCYPSPDIPHTPCLSNKYVNKFFLSSASPSSSVNRCDHVVLPVQ